ncbi:SDR family NAD(P)-dependent oxidoreductase, partial [Acinetobacter baumannii]
YAVCVNYVSNREAAESVAGQIRAAGGRAITVAGDVSKEEDVLRLFTTTDQELGRVTALVNNAGITQDPLAMRMKDEEWDSVIATNLTAVGRLSRAVLRGMMKARSGRIISITS